MTAQILLLFFSLLYSSDCGNILKFGDAFAFIQDESRLLVRVELEFAYVALGVETYLLGTAVCDKADAFCLGHFGLVVFEVLVDHDIVAHISCLAYHIREVQSGDDGSYLDGIADIRIIVPDESALEVVGSSGVL